VLHVVSNTKSTPLEVDFVRKLFLHHIATAHPARTTHFAVLLVNDELVDAGKTDENVDEPLYLRPRSENHINEIPIAAAHEPTQTDQAPVEGPDDDEDPRNHVQPFIVHNDC
jgi:hypothetical protein